MHKNRKKIKTKCVLDLKIVISQLTKLIRRLRCKSNYKQARHATLGFSLKELRQSGFYKLRHSGSYKQETIVSGTTFFQDLRTIKKHTKIL